MTRSLTPEARNTQEVVLISVKKASLSKQGSKITIEYAVDIST